MDRRIVQERSIFLLVKNLLLPHHVKTKGQAAGNARLGTRCDVSAKPIYQSDEGGCM